MDPSLDSILPNGVFRKSGPCLKGEEDFLNGYTLPAHTEKQLSLLRGQIGKTEIVFHEIEHVYECGEWGKGKKAPASSSVTPIAHSLEKEFVKEEGLRLAKESKRQAWPRLEYVVSPLPLNRSKEGWNYKKGILITRGGNTLASLPPHKMKVGSTVEEAVSLLNHLAIHHDSLGENEVFVFERGMEDWEIFKAWEEKGKVASNMGTDRHYMAECFLNGEPFRWWEEDMKCLYSFCEEHLIPRGIVSYATEMVVYSHDLDLAGSLDAVFWDERKGIYHIVDFKRSDKLASQMKGFTRMKPPFSHLDSCKGAGYALQLGIYKYILEKEYDMKVGDLILLSLHSSSPFSTSVPYLSSEVEYLMSNRKEVVRARREVAAKERKFKCSLTGAPAFDAVRLKGSGEIAMMKAAQIYGFEYEEDEETRKQFEEEVERERGGEVPLHKPTCEQWWKRMPAQGIPPFSKW